MDGLKKKHSEAKSINLRKAKAGYTLIEESLITFLNSDENVQYLTLK